MLLSSDASECLLVLTSNQFYFMCRFQGINTSQSLREKPGSGSSSGNLKELRLRKSSQTDGDRGAQTDDEIVESCKVRGPLELSTNIREV